MEWEELLQHFKDIINSKWSWTVWYIKSKPFVIMFDWEITQEEQAELIYSKLNTILFPKEE